MDENRRRRTRVRTAHEALLDADGTEFRVRIRDLSLKGARTEPVPDLAEGRECGFTLPLAEDMVISARARVIRSDAQSLALDFTAIEEEGFPHLLRLVQLHYGDAEAIERELAEPAFEP